MDYQSIIDELYPAGSRLRDIYITHASQVADLALEIAARKHLEVDMDQLKAAAMLHDIGIYLTDAPGINCHGSEPYIRHGILGAEVLRARGVDEAIASVAERHTGAGITVDDIDAQGLPLPRRDFSPRTLMERLVCYADKFYSKTRLDSAKTLEQVRASMARRSPSTLARFDELHREFAIE
ncbi:MAG: HDIG domain-containing protein [Muribaculaceae bacterium]|nr:HDIG domain-containing protein [Muribaculaceae bacterium]MDE6321620.1 HDIG domain-containing protein [Muribaculaceae bacterium]